MRRAALIALSIAMATSCAGMLESGGMADPKPAVSEYFETVGSRIAVEPGLAQTHFALTLRVVSPPPQGAILLAEFEDPCGGSAVAAEPQRFKAQTQLIFRSPTIGCLKRVTAYEALVRVYSDETRATLLSTHRQLIRSQVDSKSFRR